MVLRLVGMLIILSGLVSCALPSQGADISLGYSHGRDYHKDYGVIKKDVINAEISDKKGDLGWSVSKGYGKTGDIVTRNDGELNVVYDPAINDRWSAWFFDKVGYDKTLGIDFENQIGVGLKHNLTEVFSVSFGVLHHTRKPENYNDERWSLRAKFKNEVFKGTYFYQPVIGDSDDYISKGEGELGISEVFGLYGMFKYRHIDDSQVNEVGIRANFKIGGQDD